MRMNTDPEWLKRQAALEDEHEPPDGLFACSPEFAAQMAAAGIERRPVGAAVEDPPGPPDTLWRITDDFQRVEALLWAADEASTAPARAELEAQAEAAFQALLPRLQEKTGGIVALIRQNDIQAGAAKQEAGRIVKLQKRREAVRDRLKEFLKRAMDAMNLARVSGPAFEVSVRKAGGKEAVSWDGRPVPIVLAKAVTVDPAALVEGVYTLRHLSDQAPEDILAMLGVDTDRLEISPAKVHEWVETHKGEIPEGASLSRGTYLAIE